jgi:hypothetical protein
MIVDDMNLIVESNFPSVNVLVIVCDLRRMVVVEYSSL